MEQKKKKINPKSEVELVTMTVMATKKVTKHRSKSTTMPDGWLKRKTGDGKRYYENTMDQSTSWDAPLAATGGSTGRIAKGTIGIKMNNDNDNDNDTDEVKIFVQSTAEEKNQVGLSSGSGNGGHVRNPTFLPPGWTRLEDEHGIPYYQNPVTGKTQWEKPEV